MERTAIIKRLNAIRPALLNEGVRHVALFGSRARQDHRSDSDIDLLLDVDPGKKFSILNLVGVEHLVEDATGIRANAFMRRSLKPEFRQSIASDVIEIF
ncbi:nucleotidyltransferase domain-containing protein [Mesorhizobium sp. CN5-321]|jgi:predicted nucleotidyltransferase|uniref:nucleotidyltransferase family protein n=1 Tax=Mesorhizobium hunchu TaxID=3157708 RepID=UPI0032B87166